MSTMTLIIILAIVIAVATVVVKFMIDHKKDIKDIREVRKHKRNGDALLIDYWRTDEGFVTTHHKWWFRKTTKWTHESDEEIYLQGYYQTDRWMTDLRYFGVPVFVKLHNFKIIDPEQLPEPYTNRLTSSVLYNVYHAQNMKRYIAGLTKIGFAPIDLKGAAVVIPVIIGLAIGVFYFMGGFGR